MVQSLGDNDVTIAAGMESMTNIPYILPKARQGYRMGHEKVMDAMLSDGEWSVLKPWLWLFSAYDENSTLPDANFEYLCNQLPCLV